MISYVCKWVLPMHFSQNYLALPPITIPLWHRKYHFQTYKIIQNLLDVIYGQFAFSVYHNSAQQINDDAKYFTGICDFNCCCGTYKIFKLLCLSQPKSFNLTMNIHFRRLKDMLDANPEQNDSLEDSWKEMPRRTEVLANRTDHLYRRNREHDLVVC